MLSRSPFAGVIESAGEAYRALGRSSVVPPQVLFAPGARRAAGRVTTVAAAARAAAKTAAGGLVRWLNKQRGEDGSGNGHRIRNYKCSFGSLLFITRCTIFRARS